jgi:hypothetical protein
MSIRLSKVRRTDYRPAGAPAAPKATVRRKAKAPAVLAIAPREMDAFDHIARIQRSEAQEHDAAIRAYPDHLLIAAGEDLLSRSAWDRKDPEQRWVMSRRAAIQREALRRNLHAPN